MRLRKTQNIIKYLTLIVYTSGVDDQLFQVPGREYIIAMENLTFKPEKRIGRWGSKGIL